MANDDDDEGYVDPKELILGTVEDLVQDFIYYDRKEDEELQVGAIESAIEIGQITVDEIVLKFREVLTSLIMDDDEL